MVFQTPVPISLVILIIGIQDLYTSKYKYTIKSETQKREILKIQLRFRKIVLQQVYPANKDVYKYSKKGEGQFNSAKLATHLTQLINATHHDSPFNSTSDPVLVGKSIDHQFEDSQVV